MKPSGTSILGPLDAKDVEVLQALLESLPSGLDPLDATSLDGFLCAVLLQPTGTRASLWLKFVIDTEGRAPPAHFDMRTLRSLVVRRYDELEEAIENRRWFDPWVFELEGEASPSEAVYPWVAGFAFGANQFPGLMRPEFLALREPLALLYRHLHADDLEDADELLDEIDTFEPPADLAEAVQDLVRATLLWADVTRPRVEPLRSSPRRQSLRSRPR
jgi:uncharacterized protein